LSRAVKTRPDEVAVNRIGRLLEAV